MIHAAKNLLKESMFVQRAYRRYVQPHLRSFEPETFVLGGIAFDECVDVGANAGIYSILLSRNAKRVHAFEPVRRMFDILRNLHIANLSLYNVALGSEAGHMDIALPLVDGEIDYGSASLVHGDDAGQGRAARQRVAIVPFDALENEIDFGRIDFVKIDVEGFEMQVLRGMGRLLQLKKAAFMIEIELRHNRGYRDVFALLAARDYVPYVTPDGACLRRLDVAELPALQSAERFEMDKGRSYRPGDRKNYINNIFFLQPEHRGKFPVV